MAIKIPYTQREFNSILTEVRDRIRDELPEVNDFLESNIGRFMIETYAAIADMLAFNIDRQAAETYIDTVETRQNLVSILKLINFQPNNPSPEETGVIFSIDSAQPTDLVIPKYTALAASTRNGLPWVTTGTATILAGQLSTQGEVQAKQGQLLTINFISTSAPFQRYLVNDTGVAEGTVQVFVNTFEWKQAELNTFAGHASSDTVFRVVNRSDRSVVVEFGDDIEGMIPSSGSDIDIRFLSTKHINGSVQAGEIDTVTASFPLAVRVNNPRASTGGADYETVSSAKLRYPAVFKSQRRAVTLDDWEAVAKSVPGVLQTKAVDKNADSSLDFFEVKVLVLGTGDPYVSATLNSEVKSFLDARKTSGSIAIVESPDTVETSVELPQLYVQRLFDPDEVGENVLTAITDFFTLTDDESAEVQLGEPVRRSRLSSTIQNVEGVSSFTMIIRVKRPESVLTEVSTPTATTLTLQSVGNFPALSGKIKVNDEIMSYDDVDTEANQLTSVIRGIDGTTATSHLATSGVFLVMDGDIYVNPDEFVLLTSISVGDKVVV